MTTTIEQLQQDKQSLENSISGLINTFIYTHEGISLDIDIRSIDTTTVDGLPKQHFDVKVNAII